MAGRVASLGQQEDVLIAEKLKDRSCRDALGYEKGKASIQVDEMSLYFAEHAGQEQEYQALCEARLHQ